MIKILKEIVILSIKRLVYKVFALFQAFFDVRLMSERLKNYKKSAVKV